MSFLFDLLMLLIAVAIVAFLYGEGIWSNTIILVNATLAGLLAMNFFEPLAGILDDLLPGLRFASDFVCLWSTFIVSMLVLRIATDRISQVQVRFLKIAEQFGSPGVALLAAMVVVSFTVTTFHTAPLGTTFMWGGFDPERRMVLGTAPDRAWLSFTHQVSAGSLHRLDVEEGAQVFDPNHQFIETYRDRRQALEDHLRAADWFYAG